MLLLRLLLAFIVTADGQPVPFVAIRSTTTPALTARTGGDGRAAVQAPAGTHQFVLTRLGFRPETVTVELAGAADTTLSIELTRIEHEQEEILVSATRGGRRVDDTPIRVEVIDEEEVAEKVAMTPGDIAMMLNETGGLRVQVSSPGVGGASVRIQGLGGRHSLILSDGLPLYGGQTGGLGLLQIPPVDLARVEIIKGAAAALYGSAALGGVVNLISRRPGPDRETTVLLNRTTQGGTDAVVMASRPLSENWGVTLLGGHHRQRWADLARDGWADIPGYERSMLRPRFYFDDGSGRTALLTAGFMTEDRRGGTMDNGVVGAEDHVESLDSERADVGALLRWEASGAIITLRGSAMRQGHSQRIDQVRENDRHRTLFAEAAVALPRGPLTWVGGVAFQEEAYEIDEVTGFDETRSTPSLFAQVDADVTSWSSLSASARLDDLRGAGAYLNPRLSLLLRRGTEGALAGWSLRASAGTGAFAPTARVEATEPTGLNYVLPPTGLLAERALTGSVDVGGPIATALGTLEVHGSLFGARVRSPLTARDSGTVPALGFPYLSVVNSTGPTRTTGAELLLRLTRELGAGDEAPMFRATVSYTHLRATECDPADALEPDCLRRTIPLTPRDALGVVMSVEREGRSRIGVEFYHTGRQELFDDPYLAEGRPYLILGALAEREVETRAGTARLFVNLENLTNVRQVEYAPLARPAPAAGGRLSTDAWTELSGFTINGGVRFSF